MAARGYKKKLIAVSDLKREGIVSLHRRVTLLVQVFDDAEWRADAGCVDGELETILDRYVDDCALSFMELRTVMQEFPKVEAWQSTNLRELYEQATARQNPKKPPSERKTRESVSIKDYRQLEARLNEVECVRRSLHEEVQHLRQENRELRDENRVLSGRIQELDRMCERLSGDVLAGTAR